MGLGSAYQDTIMNSMKERLEGLTISLEQVYSEANSEISRLQGKVAALSTSEDDLKRKNHELKEGWREKSRKLAQTQVCTPNPGRLLQANPGSRSFMTSLSAVLSSRRSVKARRKTSKGSLHIAASTTRPLMI